MPRLLLMALSLLAVVRFVLAMTLELSPEEASLWVAAQRPALGYAEYGPLAPWLVWVGVKLFGAQALAVRWLGPGLFFLLSLVVWRWAMSLFRPKAGAWAVLVINLLPLLQTGLLMGLVFQLSLFFQVISAWAIWLALRRAGAAWGKWSLAGLSMGLGVLNHASGWVVPGAVFLLFVLVGRWRGQLRRWGWWWALMITGMTFLPWAYWLQAHDWLPWHAWFDRHRTWWRWSELVQGVGKFFGYATPLIALGIVWAVVLASWHRMGVWFRRYARIWQSWQGGEVAVVEEPVRPAHAQTEDPFALAADDLRPTAAQAPRHKEPTVTTVAPMTFWRRWARTWAHWRSRCAPDLADSELFLLGLFWPSLLVMIILSARGAELDMWLTGPVVFGLLLLVGRWLDHGLPSFVARLAQNSALTLAAVYCLFGMPHDLCRHLGVPLAYSIDPTARWHGWAQLATEVKSLLAEREQQGLPPLMILTHDPNLAAVLDFHLPSETPGLRTLPQQPRLQPLSRSLGEHNYVYWPRYDDHGVLSPTEVFSALFITTGKETAKPPGPAQQRFQQVTPLGQFEIIRGGHPLRRVIFFAAQGWLGENKR